MRRQQGRVDSLLSAVAQSSRLQRRLVPVWRRARADELPQLAPSSACAHLPHGACPCEVSAAAAASAAPGGGLSGGAPGGARGSLLAAAPLRTAAGLRAYNGSTRFLRAAALGRLSAGWRTWPRASSSRIPTRPRAPHAGCSCCAPRATPSGLTTCIRSTPSSGELVSARCAAPARTCCLSTGLWRSDGYAEVPGTGLVAIAVRCANALGRPRRDCIASHARPGSRPVPCRGPDDFVLTG